jgi:hypothetical protein
MKKKCFALMVAGLLAVSVVAPAAAYHGGTPGAEAECMGISIAEAVTGYESGYC